MLIETIAAIFLLGCLACFFSINLHNILRVKKGINAVKTYAETEPPSGFGVGLAALGTVVYFLEVLFYLFLVFTELISTPLGFPFHFEIPFKFYMQILGIVLSLAGYTFSVWSVVARGRYAVSWKMPEDQKLVTWGPYCYVRHPSYLGYILMFFGFFSLWPNLFTLIPLVAIPGYYRVALEEERLLIRRFGDEYEKYRKKTGRFIPKLHYSNINASGKP